jgi:diadenosine tetraphosphatase ApaH/serine/threonine PP2A family protein phosphatase
VLERSTGAQAEKRWEFLGELNRRYLSDDEKFMYVHGSARNPLNEYVFPDDIYNQVKMEKIFALIPQYCFQGHTHIPGVFTERLEFLAPEEIDLQYQLGPEKVMINVGSVGQPRNNDPRSSYVTIDGDLVRFHRVEYNIEKTAGKIYDIPDLDNFLGDRLREGR